MKKKKQLLSISTPVSRISASAHDGTPEQGAVISSRSLLNKYNQKKPSGARKLSPAADEEME